MAKRSTERETTALPRVKYVRLLKKKTVYAATEMLLANRDMYPCDEKGVLLNATQFQMTDPDPTVEGKAQDKYNIDVLRARAKELKILGFNNAKAETLSRKIEEVEIETAGKAEAIRIQNEKEADARAGADRQAKAEKDAIKQAKREARNLKAERKAKYLAEAKVRDEAKAKKKAEAEAKEK